MYFAKWSFFFLNSANISISGLMFKKYSKRGYLSGRYAEYVLGSTKETSLIDCARRCSEQMQCAIFSFIKFASLCNIMIPISTYSFNKQFIETAVAADGETFYRVYTVIRIIKVILWYYYYKLPGH